MVNICADSPLSTRASDNPETLPGHITCHQTRRTMEPAHTGSPADHISGTFGSFDGEIMRVRIRFRKYTAENKQL